MYSLSTACCLVQSITIIIETWDTSYHHPRRENIILHIFQCQWRYLSWLILIVRLLRSWKGNWQQVATFYYNWKCGLTWPSITNIFIQFYLIESRKLSQTRRAKPKNDVYCASEWNDLQPSFARGVFVCNFSCV